MTIAGKQIDKCRYILPEIKNELLRNKSTMYIKYFARNKVEVRPTIEEKCPVITHSNRMEKKKLRRTHGKSCK